LAFEGFATCAVDAADHIYGQEKIADNRLSLIINIGFSW
jgi:hypothetical protein